MRLGIMVFTYTADPGSRSVEALSLFGSLVAWGGGCAAGLRGAAAGIVRAGPHRIGCGIGTVTLDVSARAPAPLRRSAPLTPLPWAVLWIVAIAGEALSLRPV